MTTIFERKDEEQQKALRAWTIKNRRASIIAGTGVGKTRIMLLCAQELLSRYSKKEKEELNFYFISPLADLEKQIRDECEKWGLSSDILPYVEFYTIHKARKFKGVNIEGVFVDEIHMTLADDLDESARKFYTSNNIRFIAGFTATWPENQEYGQFLSKLAPKAYDLSFEEAKDKDLVANYILFKVPVKLLPGEQVILNQANYMYNKCQYDLLGEISPSEMFQEAGYILKTGTGTKDEKRIAAMYFNAIRKRKAVINNAENKHVETVNAVQLLSSGKNKARFLTFNGGITLATSLTRRINRELKSNGIKTKAYHSKLGMKARSEILENFKDKRHITGLNTVDAANAALDVPDLEYIVLNGITSKALPMIQRVGRAARWVEGKKAKAILFYVKDSQEEKWMNNATKSFGEVVTIDNVNLMKDFL